MVVLVTWVGPSVSFRKRLNGVADKEDVAKLIQSHACALLAEERKDIELNAVSCIIRNSYVFLISPPIFLREHSWVYHYRSVKLLLTFALTRS